MRPLSILAVEDDDDEAFFIQRGAKQVGGIDLVRQDSGQAALDYLRDRLACGAGVPDAIVTDIKMPGMDGFEFLEHLATIPELAVVPRVVLSSSKHPKDIKRAHELGSARFFTKPSDAFEFSSVLEAIVGYVRFSTST